MFPQAPSSHGGGDHDIMTSPEASATTRPLHELLSGRADAAPDDTALVFLADGGGDERRFTWDAAGNLRKLGGEGDVGEQVVVPLNEANPALGHLEPPHEPGDTRPRLEISFGVNADRWLIATVKDLKTRKVLMNAEPVARLL